MGIFLSLAGKQHLSINPSRQFLFAPFWGRLSDRIGRRPVILIGLFGSFLAYLFFGLATSLTLLFVARIFAGIAGANVSTAQAYMADVTTPENRARGMGLVGAAFGLGFIFTIIGTLNPANAKTNLFVNKLGAFFELNNSWLVVQRWRAVPRVLGRGE